MSSHGNKIKELEELYVKIKNIRDARLQEAQNLAVDLYKIEGQLGLLNEMDKSSTVHPKSKGKKKK